MEYWKFSRSLAILLLLISSVNDGRAQATDPKVVEAAKKEGGEIEAYVTLRTDTAQYIWKMFEAKYPFLRVKQYKADSDKMLQRLATEDRVVDDCTVTFEVTKDGYWHFPLGSKVQMRLVHIFEMRDGMIARELVFDMGRPE